MGGRRLRSLDHRADSATFTAPGADRTTRVTLFPATPSVLGSLSGSSR